MVLKEILALVGVPLIRAFAGWAENAMKDGEVSKLEWRQLGETVLRVGILSAGTYFGLNGLGIDVSAFAAAGAGVVIDFFIMAFKKKSE